MKFEERFEFVAGKVAQPLLSRCDGEFCELSLFRHHFVNALFKGAARDQAINLHFIFLPNTVRTVGCLVFHRWIPPEVIVHHNCGGHEI